MIPSILLCAMSSIEEKPRIIFIAPCTEKSEMTWSVIVSKAILTSQFRRKGFDKGIEGPGPISCRTHSRTYVIMMRAERGQGVAILRNAICFLYGKHEPVDD